MSNKIRFKKLQDVLIAENLYEEIDGKRIMECMANSPLSRLSSKQESILSNTVLMMILGEYNRLDEDLVTSVCNIMVYGEKENKFTYGISSLPHSYDITYSLQITVKDSQGNTYPLFSVIISNEDSPMVTIKDSDNNIMITFNIYDY